ncbi:MAG: hypothetical protein IT384_18280 [Deltaproteobacteria bacterium]|nr:hypothetical protein [Deltaproteobacteria bacterium]
MSQKDSSERGRLPRSPALGVPGWAAAPSSGPPRSGRPRSSRDAKPGTTEPASASAPPFQTPEQRTELLERVARGDVSLATLLGLSKCHLDALANVAATSFAARRFDVAAKYFAALAALDAQDPLHPLHLADAEAAAGRVPEALAALDRFLTHPVPGTSEDRIRALELRVILLAPTDRARAATDLATARALQEELSR